MNRRLQLTLVAAAATLLATTPFIWVFHAMTWFGDALFGVAVVVGAAIAVRASRGPVLVQLLAMVAALTEYLTLRFPNGGEFGGVLPTRSTLEHFGSLLSLSLKQAQGASIPAPDLPAVLLLTTLGICFAAILVDLFAVGLHRPALAGLPLLAIYAVPAALLPSGGSLAGFCAGSFGFLWLLMTDHVGRVSRFGRRYSSDGRGVEGWEGSPLATAGRRLGAVALVSALLLPIALPSATEGLISNWINANAPAPNGSAAGGAGGAGSGRVDLFAVLAGNLNRDKSSVLVRVHTDDPSPYYLRFGVADQIGLDGFTTRPLSGGTSVDDLPPVAEPGSGAAKFHAGIQPIGLNMPLAPVYPQVISISGLDPTWSYDIDTGQVFNAKQVARGASYGIEYLHTSYTGAVLRAAPTAPVPVAKTLVEVPDLPEVSALVQRLTKGKTSEYDRVRAIYDYFGPNNGFSYALSTKAGTSGTAITDFLANKQGFCVQYAAAMAWLVRVAGYPSRVAFGFTRGTSTGAGEYTLTTLNLHAWTEVYFPVLGWVPFDATPAADVLGSVLTEWAPNNFPPVDAPSPDPDETANPSSPTPTASASTNTGAATSPIKVISATAKRFATLLWSIFGAVLVLLLLLSPALTRRATRRRRSATLTAAAMAEHDPPASAPETGGAGEQRLRAAAQGKRAPHELQELRLRAAHAAWAELVDTIVDFGAVGAASAFNAVGAVAEVGGARGFDATGTAVGARDLFATQPVTHPRPSRTGSLGSAGAGRRGSTVDPALTPRRTVELVAKAFPRGTKAWDALMLLGAIEERARYAPLAPAPDGVAEALAALSNTLTMQSTQWQRIKAGLAPRSVLIRWRVNRLIGYGRLIGAVDRAAAALRRLTPRWLLPVRDL